MIMKLEPHAVVTTITDRVHVSDAWQRGLVREVAVKIAQKEELHG